MFQSRRSLLIWKIYGKRLDGWTQRRLPDRDDARRRAARSQLKGKPVANTPANRNRADLDYTGSIMPPPEAVKSGQGRRR